MMSAFNLKNFYFTLVVLSTVANVMSQVPEFSKVPVLQEGDSLNISYLIQNGVRVSKGKVICWFPKDSLSEIRMNEIANMIDVGITAAEKFIHAPRDWQAQQPNDAYTFYFRLDRIISHASGAGFISISFWRIKSGKSPWLHEAMHEMLYTNKESWHSKEITEEEWSRHLPLWLFEGLPDYISLEVSLKENLPWFDVFSNSSQTNIDSIFLKEVRSDKGSYVLSHIGRKGVMPELSSSDRMLYAPAFYHGSSSFVRYLADNYGLEILLKSISSFRQEHETIEKATGKSIEVLKKDWLHKLNL